MAITEVVNLLINVQRNAARNIGVVQQALGKTQEEIYQLDRRSRIMRNGFGRLTVGIRKTFLGMRGFRMEMLSVMFFGMGMAAMFNGLLNPALQMAGVFEVMGQTLAILFLPVALEMLDWALKFMEIVGNLSPEMQKAIGVFVVVGAILGTFLFILGSVVLGLGGLVAMFTGPFAFIGPIVVGILGTVLFWIGLIIAIVAVLFLAWKNNFGGMRDWLAVAVEGIKNIFSGLMDTLRGDFLGGFRKISLGIVQLLGGLVVSLGLAALNLGKTIVNGIIDGIKAIGSKIWETLLSFIPDSFKKFFSGVGKAIGGAVSGARGLLPFAEGGIVSRPTPALIGEAGPEAVVPLDKIGSLGGVVNNININASVTSEIDMNSLSRMIADEVSNATERSLRR